MSVTRGDVEKIARLAEVRIEDDQVEPLAEQLSRIIEYVARLSDVPAGETLRPFIAGPDAIRLRPDEVRPWPLAFPPAKLAPALREGLFTVPRLGQFEDAETEEDDA
jgi:aspartyl-tRNA(Asn)/glutamyl-tRNA(Gln) amidotransferase subunit C